jgi:hypothetical protein
MGLTIQKTRIYLSYKWTMMNNFIYLFKMEDQEKQKKMLMPALISLQQQIILLSFLLLDKDVSLVRYCD